MALTIPYFKKAIILSISRHCAGLENLSGTNQNGTMTAKCQLLLMTLLMSGQSFAGEPITFPLGKMGGGDLEAVLPSEKSLIILALAGQVIWALLSYIYKIKEKKSDKTEVTLERLYKLVHEIQADVKILKSAPSEDELFKRLYPHVKLAAIEAVQKYRMGKP